MPDHRWLRTQTSGLSREATVLDSTSTAQDAMPQPTMPDSLQSSPVPDPLSPAETDRPKNRAASPSDTGWLWIVCVLLAAVIFGAWSSTRWKPLVVYPLGIGLLIGVLTVVGERFAGVVRPRSAVWVMCGAGMLLLGIALGLSARQHALASAAAASATPWWAAELQQSLSPQNSPPPTNHFRAAWWQRYPADHTFAIGVCTLEFLLVALASGLTLTFCKPMSNSAAASIEVDNTAASSRVSEV
jgi:hypothetical protein